MNMWNDYYHPSVLETTKSPFNTSSVSSLTLSNKVQRYAKCLTYREVSCLDKIRIANFLANKLYLMYRLNDDLITLIVETMRQIILREESLTLPIRLFFLRFRNVKVVYNIAVQIYKDGIKNRIDSSSYLQILQYLLQCYLTSPVLKRRIVQDLEIMFNDNRTDELLKMEIADVCLLSGHIDQGERFLRILRNRQIRREIVHIAHLPDPDAEQPKTVYGDSQNVHNHKINESVLKAAVNLIVQEYSIEVKQPSFDKIEKELVRLLPEKKEAISHVLTRIQIDTSKYTYKTKTSQDRFNLYDVFKALWSYINKHPDKDELHRRLLEEICSMDGYCSTGHLSRLMNVIQGFTNDPDLEIRISMKDQIKAVLTTYLNKELKEAPKEVVESLTENNPISFYDYVQKIVTDKLPQFRKDYGKDVDKHLPYALESYTKKDGWKIEKDTVSY